MDLLLPEEIEKLPEYYAQDHGGDEAIAHVKFFSVESNFIWYGCEFNRKTQEFWGFISGHELEWGYFSIPELQSYGNVVREWNFVPCSIAEIRESLQMFKIEQVEGGSFSLYWKEELLTDNLANIKTGLAILYELLKLAIDWKNFDKADMDQKSLVIQAIEETKAKPFILCHWEL